MSDHLIAEANRHAKALPKMTLPTTKPNAIDYARLMREWEFLDDRNKVLERENAALREALKPLLRHRPDGDIGWRGNTKAKCGWILVSDVLRIESALGKEAQP